MTAGGTAGAYAEFTVLRPVKDSTLIESPVGALANGSGPAIFSGRIGSSSGSIRRALLAFDIAAAIPPGSTVTNARLRLNLSSTSAGPASTRLYRVLADWGEGASSSSGGAGAPSVAGDSTWIHRFYDDVFWTQPGGDFDPFPRGAALVDQPGPYAWESTPEMVADVQSWLDAPAQNFGWILLGDETRPQTAKRFDSRENPEEACRPFLEVGYIPPCAPDPVGPGYWRRQCEDPTRAGLADWILPCTNRILGDLDLPWIDPCDAVLSEPPLFCEDRAARKLSVLVLNICAGRLQTSCAVAPEAAECLSTGIGDLLREISDLIRAGDCRRAAGCAATPH
jgi:hypothetical protein